MRFQAFEGIRADKIRIGRDEVLPVRVEDRAPAAADPARPGQQWLVVGQTPALYICVGENEDGAVWKQIGLRK